MLGTDCSTTRNSRVVAFNKDSEGPNYEVCLSVCLSLSPSTSFIVEKMLEAIHDNDTLDNVVQVTWFFVELWLTERKEVVGRTWGKRIEADTSRKRREEKKKKTEEYLRFGRNNKTRRRLSRVVVAN